MLLVVALVLFLFSFILLRKYTLPPPSNLGMEPLLPPPRTPVAIRFKNGDLVQVFHGTGAYVEGRKTVAYIGRIVGYNEALGKWEADL